MKITQTDGDFHEGFCVSENGKTLDCQNTIEEALAFVSGYFGTAIGMRNVEIKLIIRPDILTPDHREFSPAAIEAYKRGEALKDLI